MLAQTNPGGLSAILALVLFSACTSDARLGKVLHTGSGELEGFYVDENEGFLKLSDMMSQYWINFARTGDPNGENLPPWPRYREANDELLEFGETVEATKHPRRRKLDVFDAVFRNSVQTQ